MDDVDPEVLEQLRHRARIQIRKRQRSVRAAHPASARAERSRRVVDRLLELGPFREARALALYWPHVDRGELDVREADTVARAAGKRIYYPFIRGAPDRPELGFARADDPSALADRGHHFAEPPEDAPEAAPGDLHLVVVPCIAAADTGHRLGHGSGFYDRVLPVFCPPATSVVVAFDFQLVAEIPTVPTDFACQLVVTDARTLDPGEVL